VQDVVEALENLTAQFPREGSAPSVSDIRSRVIEIEQQRSAIRRQLEAQSRFRRELEMPVASPEAFQRFHSDMCAAVERATATKAQRDGRAIPTALTRDGVRLDEHFDWSSTFRSIEESQIVPSKAEGAPVPLARCIEGMVRRAA